MKIAIDCRYIGKSGIGRVCEGILDALDYGAHEYFLFGDRRKLEGYAKKGAHLVEDLSEPYSFHGLRTFDRSLNKRCDAILIPNFLIPFGVKIPILSVMHDLAFLDVKETTKGFKDKLVKKTLLKRCMKKSRWVSCVSEFTRSRCEYHYGKLAKKCYVNYNGLSRDLIAYAAAHPAAEKEDKVVFVGNVKAHKGISVLLSAFAKVGGGMKLKIIGQKENFLTGMKFDEQAYRNVEFTGRLGDEELSAEIASAKYLVLPSRYEGFGLPPLEALVLGTQPIVSDIPVFREVYAGLPVKYFRTEEELRAALAEPPQPFDVKAVTETIVKRYDYQRQARAILEKLETLA